MYKTKYRKPEEMKDSQLEWIGCIPQNWKVIRVKHRFKLKKDKSYSKKPNVLSLTQRGIIERDISNNEGQLASSYEGYISIQKGDFVLNPMDLISGYVDKSKYEGVISPAYTTFTSINNDIDNDYYKYYYQMHYHHNYFFPYGEGVSFVHRWTLKNERFLNYPILCCDKFEQQKIANFLDIKTAQFDSIISKKEKLIEKLEEAKKSLISEVVTGKVKIVDGQLVKRQPEEMKDSGVEWLGMIPKEWEVKKLKYLVDKVGSGKTPKGGSEVYTDEGVTFLRSQNIHNDGLRLDDVVYIDKKIDREMMNTKVQYKDILLNITGASIGRCTMFLIPDKLANVNQHVCIIRLSKSVEHENYYLYVMQSNLIQDQILSYQTGASREGLNFEQIKNLYILVPLNKEEKKNIVNYLNRKCTDINKIIYVTKNQIQKLKQAKQSLISEAVTGKIDLRDWEIIEEGE